MKFEKIIEFHKYNRFDEILYILHKNNRKFLNDSLTEYNLNLLQAMCLLIIDERDDVNQQELTQMLFLTKGGITKALRKLENDGYIMRKQSEIDGRKHILILTDKGNDIIPHLERINKTWEEMIGIDELDEEFLKTIKKLAYNSIKLNSEE